VYPHVTTLQCRTLPSSHGRLWCHHMSCVSGSRLPDREGFGIATCLVVLDLASLIERALVSPHV
jgi:hypothetical protein